MLGAHGTPLPHRPESPTSACSVIDPAPDSSALVPSQECSRCHKEGSALGLPFIPPALTPALPSGPVIGRELSPLNSEMPFPHSLCHALPPLPSPCPSPAPYPSLVSKYSRIVHHRRDESRFGTQEADSRATLDIQSSPPPQFAYHSSTVQRREGAVHIPCSDLLLPTQPLP